MAETKEPGALSSIDQRQNYQIMESVRTRQKGGGLQYERGEWHRTRSESNNRVTCSCNKTNGLNG